jgi:hypothetical protein
MRSGVCLCCHARDYFALTSFKVPWMYLGMLALGLPPMLAAPLPARIRARRWWTGIVSGIGMVAGMAWGASLALRWAGPMHPQQFLIALGGMTLGMLAGMFFACELGRMIGETMSGWRGGHKRTGPLSVGQLPRPVRVESDIQQSR